MIVFGKHPVREFLENSPDVVLRVWVDHEAKQEEFPGAEIVDADRMETICGGGNHQGYALKTRDFQYTPLENVIGHDVLAVLDQVQDPRNLGAILRTAAAFDIPVILPKDRSASVNETVVRTSAGLVFRIPVVQVTNITRVLTTLRDEGYWSIAATADGEQKIEEVAMDPKTILVLGGEAGVRRLTRETCDFTARIPMQNDVESLNVSVGFSIFAYEFRRRNPAGGEP